MEQNNLQIVAKKFWHMVRVAIFMLRKGILKSKLFSDFSIMMKRGKIAGKAIHNLMFHHGHQWAATASTTTTTRHCHIHDYEFSCNNTPMQTFNLSKRKKNIYHNDHIWLENVRTDPNYNHLSPQSHPEMVEDEIMSSEAVTKALEMLQSAAESPALPGFGRSPMVRQLRITDSPFPLNYCGDEEGNQVDEAAENFIKKFYKDLRKQNLVAAY